MIGPRSRHGQPLAGRTLWLLLRAVSLAAALLALALPALAHPTLLASEPAPGEELRRPPAEIRLRFDKALEADSHFVLYRAAFELVPGVSGKLDPAAPEQLVATAPALEPGVYTVQWTAVESDGHPVTGSYSFGVREAASGPAAPVWLLAAGGFVVLALAGLAWSRRGRWRVT